MDKIFCFYPNFDLEAAADVDQELQVDVLPEVNVLNDVLGEHMPENKNEKLLHNLEQFKFIKGSL